VTNYETILKDYTRKLSKAIQHLEYSHKKVGSLPTDPEKLDEEGLETWESYAACFARVTDLFLTKYLRAKILMLDPGFSGSLRDLLNTAEKNNFVEKANYWMGIRELRNLSVHEYTEAQLKNFFETLKRETPELLRLQSEI
jgi:hypothetical protein